jgi:uncharacterized protein (TIGR03000 family)
VYNAFIRVDCGAIERRPIFPSGGSSMSKYLFAALLGTVVLLAGPGVGHAQMMNAPRSASIGVNGPFGGTSVGRFSNYGNYGYPRGYYDYPPSYYAPYYYSTPNAYAAPRVAYYYPEAGSPDAASAAEITVRVPADAELWLDGNATKQRGDTRTFVSPVLQPGRTFTYEFRARWMKDGKPVEATRTVDIRAGAKTTVDLRNP